MEFFNHGYGESSLSVEDFGGTGGATEVGDHVFVFQSVLIHVEENVIDGVDVGEVELGHDVGVFPFIDEGEEGGEFVAFGSVGLGVEVRELDDALEGVVSVFACFDNGDGNGGLHGGDFSVVQVE